MTTPTPRLTSRLPNSTTPCKRELRAGHERAVAALRPGRAAEPALGQPHRRARHHDQAQQHHGDAGEPRVQRRRAGVGAVPRGAAGALVSQWSTFATSVRAARGSGVGTFVSCREWCPEGRDRHLRRGAATWTWTGRACFRRWRRGASPLSRPVWDDPEVDWLAFELVIVRSTWDYPRRRDAFVAWAERLPRVLNTRGGAAVEHRQALPRRAARRRASRRCRRPSRLPGRRCTLPDWEEFVIKPTVSVGSADTARWRRGTDDEAARATEGPAWRGSNGNAAAVSGWGG